MKAPSRFLETAVALVKQAGEKILALYPCGFRVGQMPDGSPLTTADLVSHHFLTEALSRLNGGFPVLSKLSPPPAPEERRTWETYWLLTPLDGADSFIKRSGEFTVNLALIHQNQPVLGVVYAPATQTCYFAAEGCGAFKQLGQNEPQAIEARPQAPQHPQVVGDPAGLGAYLDHLGGHHFDATSNALAFCQIAEGKADLYPKIGISYEWDTAAAQCIVEAAGGAVVDLYGKPLLYNAKPSLANPFFLAFGDTARDWLCHAEGIEGSPDSAPPPPPPLLKAIIALAINAGAKILDIYRSDFRIGHKTDDSPFTAADLVSHHYLTERLETLDGRFPVLSEESPPCPFEERDGWDSYWLVDPLDGVCGFIRRDGEFTVNIALIQGHKPVLGVVYAPVTQTCYFAAASGGAFKQVGAGFPEAIHTRRKAPQTLRVLLSPAPHTPELDAYLVGLGEYEQQALGSALKLCKIAEGGADVYPRFGPSYEWHTAAAQCIVEAAGGAVTGFNGEPLAYNAKSDLTNPCFVVFGDRSRDWRACGEGVALPQGSATVWLKPLPPQ